MKSLLVKTLVVSCLMGLVAIGFAQNAEKGKKGKGNDPTAALRKKVADSDLGADLKEKIGKVIDEHAPKIKEAQAKVAASLTDEQKKTKAETTAAGKAAGKSGKDIAADVKAALKLTDEQQKAVDEAQKALQTANAEMNKAVSALLSDEQIQKLGLGKKKKAN